MFSSICCFLTFIQISHEAGQVVLYSHHFQNFTQFIVMHTVKGIGIVNKAEIDLFGLSNLNVPLLTNFQFSKSQVFTEYPLLIALA